MGMDGISPNPNRHGRVSATHRREKLRRRKFTALAATATEIFALDAAGQVWVYGAVGVNRAWIRLNPNREPLT